MEKLGYYLEMLKDSLKQKLDIMDYILVENQRQQLVALGEEFDEEVFQITIDKKERYIQELQKLDGGFESVYQRIRELLNEQKDVYPSEIKEIQNLIGEVSSKSMELELSEKRNQKLMEECFGRIRQDIHKTKNVSRAASNYYKSMSGMNIVEPQYMDQKK